jgi:hypothetical protein
MRASVRYQTVGLIFLFLDGNGFEILSVEDLAAIQAFHVIDAISPSNNLGFGVGTDGLHKQGIALF